MEKKISVQSTFEHIDRELKREYSREKERFLEKYNLREIKTNKARTALELWK